MRSAAVRLPQMIVARGRAGASLTAALCVLAGACGDHATSPRLPADALSLNLGETRSVALGAAETMHVASGAAATEYTLVAFASPSGPVINAQVTADGVQDVTGPPSPTRTPTLSRTRLTTEPASSAFEMHLHAAEAKLLATRGDAARAAYRARELRAMRAATIPAVNDEMTINSSIDDCGPGTPRTGRVVYVSDYLVFVEDEGNPTGGFTTADYQSMSAEYETLILPVLTDNFGAPTDIDNNGGRTI